MEEKLQTNRGNHCNHCHSVHQSRTEQFVTKVDAAGYTTLYLEDNTSEHWIGNDNAVIELVDNTYGHDRYIMTKVNSTTWSARVPISTYNVTFNHKEHKLMEEEKKIKGFLK